MPPVSAGILLYRFGPNRALEVLLGRLGGPLWARREHWTIPKGIVGPGNNSHRESDVPSSGST